MRMSFDTTTSCGKCRVVCVTKKAKGAVNEDNFSSVYQALQVVTSLLFTVG